MKGRMLEMDTKMEESKIVGRGMRMLVPNTVKQGGWSMTRSKGTERKKQVYLNTVKAMGMKARCGATKVVVAVRKVRRLLYIV